MDALLFPVPKAAGWHRVPHAYDIIAPRKPEEDGVYSISISAASKLEQA
jgi:hypothetical protein